MPSLTSSLSASLHLTHPCLYPRRLEQHHTSEAHLLRILPSWAVQYIVCAPRAARTYSILSGTSVSCCRTYSFPLAVLIFGGRRVHVPVVFDERGALIVIWRIATIMCDHTSAGTRNVERLLRSVSRSAQVWPVFLVNLSCFGIFNFQTQHSIVNVQWNVPAWTSELLEGRRCGHHLMPIAF